MVPAGCALAVTAVVSERMLFVFVTGLIPPPAASPGSGKKTMGLSGAEALQVPRSSRTGRGIILAGNFIKAPLYGEYNRVMSLSQPTDYSCPQIPS